MIYTMQELDELYGDFYTSQEVDKNKKFVDYDELIKLIHRVCLQTGAEVTEQHLRLHLGVDEE